MNSETQKIFAAAEKAMAGGAATQRPPLIIFTVPDLCRLMARYPDVKKHAIGRAWGMLQLHLWQKPQNTPCN